ncbi:hypothetical protein EYF80_003006 [Liparis tanakae]|uniref:Uncharacterized protein n=1 Tax=Liparis tanakae TaxID=230148 RepID=A0A4Z2JAQ3_9TELE|nr:hypothetical protein EYF80_003006 [Liparis tanakae]
MSLTTVIIAKLKYLQLISTREAKQAAPRHEIQDRGADDGVDARSAANFPRFYAATYLPGQLVTHFKNRTRGRLAAVEGEVKDEERESGVQLPEADANLNVLLFTCGGLRT